MRRLLLPVLFSLVIGLSACNARPQNVTNAGSSSSASTTDSGDLITHNVSYSGIIEELGPNSSMQGTHKLSMDDGEFLLLASTDANLNLDTYLGKHVEVRGSLQPTIEGNGMLLKAEEVIVLDVLTDSSSSSSSDSSETSEGTKKMCGGIAGILCEDNQDCVDDSSDSCDPARGGADCSGLCIPKSKISSSDISRSASSFTSSSSFSSSASSKVSSMASKNSSTSSVASTSSSSSQASLPGKTAAMEQQNLVLSKQIYNQDSLWTQKYCTSHIAFCIPAHKNWYFKSFGATTHNLWHVEFGMSDIAELGDGAIILNLVSGSSTSMQAQDGQIKAQGTDIIGFKDWDDGTHFEIIADARLKAAVSYMLTHITPYAGAQ